MFRKQVLQDVHGIGRERTSLSKLKSYLLPIPPVDEQEIIVDRIDVIYDLLKEIDELQKKYIIDLSLLKDKIIDAGIRGKLTEQLIEDGDAEVLYSKIQEDKARLLKEGKIRKEKTPSPLTDNVPYKIPDNWMWVRLGSVCNEMLVPQRDKPKSFEGDIPWCRIEDIEGKYLNGTKSNQFVSQSTVDSMNLRINPAGTVISACSASIGVAAICTVRCITNQTFIGLVCNDGLYNEYLFYYLKASIKSLKKLGTGMTISYISQDKYRDMLIPLPPLSEQKRIVDRIEQILECFENS
jgi:type I restriction enzyme S subunit